jgi:hypothetical protein
MGPYQLQLGIGQPPCPVRAVEPLRIGLTGLTFSLEAFRVRRGKRLLLLNLSAGLSTNSGAAEVFAILSILTRSGNDRPSLQMLRDGEMR